MKVSNSIAALLIVVGCGGDFRSTDQIIDAAAGGAGEAATNTTADVVEVPADVEMPADVEVPADVASADTSVNVGGDAGTAAPPCPAGSLRVFVTSKVYMGNLGGREGGDSRCKALADAAALGPSAWRAWLSTAQVNAVELLPQGGAWCLVDRSKLVGTRSDLLSGVLKHPINLFENGALAVEPGGATVPTATWTGTLPNGFAAPNHCDSWTKDGVATLGVRGNYTVPTREWTQWGPIPSVSCSNGNRLFCFETN